MTQKKNNDLRQRAIDYILKYAVENDGRAGYNPCAYYIGFDDSNTPSEEFNNELRKYGRLESHSRQYDPDFKYGSSYGNEFGSYDDDGWSCFVINEYGRQYLKEKDKYINAPFSLFKGVKMVVTLVIDIIQIPFIIEGWISFFFNLIVKLLSRLISIILLVSFIWWPIHMLSFLGWALCDCLKQKMWGKRFLFSESAKRYMNHYPQ